jgi:hypothetical protein
MVMIRSARSCLIDVGASVTRERIAPQLPGQGTHGLSACQNPACLAELT